MVKGCREPPYPSILTDATMEKLALAKFVAQESKCEVSSWGETGMWPVVPFRLKGYRRSLQSPLPHWRAVLLPTRCVPEHWLLPLARPPAWPRPHHFVRCPHLQASTVTVHFYGLVHWEDPMDESLGPGPCHCSPPEGTITKEGVLHYKAGTSYLGKEHWKTCFVVLRWAPSSSVPQAWLAQSRGYRMAPPSSMSCGVGTARPGDLFREASLPAVPWDSHFNFPS